MNRDALQVLYLLLMLLMCLVGLAGIYINHFGIYFPALMIAGSIEKYLLTPDA